MWCFRSYNINLNLLLSTHSILKLHSKASKLNKRLQKLLLKADKRNHGSENLKNDVIGLLHEAHQMNNNIHATLDKLHHYGTHDHQINLPVALNEAKRLLGHIETKLGHQENIKDTLHLARKSLGFWSNTSEILAQQMLEVDSLKFIAANILHRLSDADHIVYKTNNLLGTAINIHETNLQNFKILADREHEIRMEKLEIARLYNTSIVPVTDELIEEIGDSHRKILQDLNDLLELKDIVRDVNEECSIGLEDIRTNWLPEARDHSADLVLRAKEYAQSFQNTKNGAEVALLAR